MLKHFEVITNSDINYEILKKEMMTSAKYVV